MIVAFVLGMGLYSIWFVVVLWTFQAQLGSGLKTSYRVFMSHFILTSFYMFLIAIRPGWHGSVTSQIFDSRGLCFILGFSLNLLVISAWFATLLFNYLKFIFYYTLMKEQLKEIRLVVQILVVLYFVSAVAFLCMKSHGPRHNFGYDNCGETTIHDKVFYQICLYMTLIINLIISGTFWNYRNWKPAGILNLQRQFEVNVCLSPMLFIGTSLCTFFGIAWTKHGQWTSGTYISIHLFEHALDSILQSWLMYYYLFGYSMDVGRTSASTEDSANDVELMLRRSPEAEEPTRRRNPDGENATHQRELRTIRVNLDGKPSQGDRSSEGSEDRPYTYQWISLPGGHPILCKRFIINSHGLDMFIVKEEKELSLIKKYQDKGVLPNLFTLVNNTSELLTRMAAMNLLGQKSESEEAKAKSDPTRRAPPLVAKRQDMSMFYE